MYAALSQNDFRVMKINVLCVSVKILVFWLLLSLLISKLGDSKCIEKIMKRATNFLENGKFSIQTFTTQKVGINLWLKIWIITFLAEN